MEVNPADIIDFKNKVDEEKGSMATTKKNTVKTKVIKKYAKLDGTKVETEQNVNINDKSWSAHLYRLFREPKREPNSKLNVYVKYLTLMTVGVLVIALIWFIIRYIQKRTGYLSPKQEIQNIYNTFHYEEGQAR